MIKIDKDVPVPTAHEVIRKTYRLLRMEIGDSFVFDKVQSPAVSSAIQGVKRKSDGLKKFITKKDGEGRRCCRVK